MSIDAAEVRRIARLARIELDEAELQTLGGQLRSICDHVAMLGELELTDVPPTAHAGEEAAGPRADVVAGSLSSEEATRNAADYSEGMFRVPRVIR